MANLIRLRQRGFQGMRTTRWASAAEQDYAYVAYNMVPAHPSKPSPMVTRPGLLVLSSALGTAHVWQYLGGFQKLDGTRYTVGIIDGKFYAYNWTTQTWTEVLTSADLSGTGITLSATATVYCVAFNDQLVVSDGVNVPWMWDGTTHGGLTRLTNCPVAFGQPQVYYAKLFVIEAGDRGTIAWSEENDATTGYESDGFNNAWTLSQTASAPLVTLLATNSALYYFRATSIGLIQGAVNSDFRTTGVHDSVSTEIGTLAPRSVLEKGGLVYFADQYGRPQRIDAVTVTPLWHDMERCFGVVRSGDVQPFGIPGETTLGTLTEARISAITTVPLPSLGLVFFFYGGIGYGFSTTGRGLQTVWESYYQDPIMGIGYDDLRTTPVILVGDSAGLLYSWGLQNNYQDWSHDTGQYEPVSQVLAGQPLAPTDDVELRFARSDLTYVPYQETVFTAYHLTSSNPIYGTATGLTWTATASDTQQHMALGLGERGRWVMPVLTAGVGTADRVAVEGWTVEGYAVSRVPAIP